VAPPAHEYHAPPRPLGQCFRQQPAESDRGALAVSKAVLIMDEPPGIDIGAKAGSLQRDQRAYRRGISIILIGSDFPSCWP
jgi:hypothetical protein